MADTFGIRKTGRVYEGGKFYAVPAEDIAAGAIFCPYPSGSGQFGVAEAPVKSGELGAFAKVGTFAFEAPDGWTSQSGQPVYYTPTTQGTGTITATKSASTIFLGFEVVTPAVPAGQIWIDLQPSAEVPGDGYSA